MDDRDNEIAVLASGEVEFRIDEATVSVDSAEGVRLLLQGLERLGWGTDWQAGLKVDDGEPRHLPPVLLRDQIEKLRASGTGARTSVWHRISLTAPWISDEEFRTRTTEPPRPRQRRFVKNGPEKPENPREVRKKAASARPEILDTRLFADPEEQLRYEVRHAYLTSVPISQRETWPWPSEYVILPSFLTDVNSQHGAVSRAQMISAIVDVVSGRVAEVNSRQAKMFRIATTRNAPPTIRADGAVAWRASVSNIAAAARRIMWWRRRDGIIELARLATHDDMDLPEK